MTADEKLYEVSIRVQMPGQQKVNEYSIPVKADCPETAFALAKAVWIDITEIRDHRVKELGKGETA